MKAVFLDRDGVINKDYSYVYQKEKFEFCEGVFESLRYFLSLGYRLFVVTNQSGIGRGYYTQEDFDELTSWMLGELTCRGVCVTKVYHCAHSPEEGCGCRKPETGMFEQAQREFGVDMGSSWMIGDKLSDIRAGVNAGISKTIFINSSTCKEASYSVKSIFDTMRIIKN